MMMRFDNIVARQHRCPAFCKDEITGTYAECVRIWLA